MDDMYDHPDGTLPESLLHAEELEQAGYQQCRNQLCNHMLSPDTLDSTPVDTNHTCAHCGLDQMPHKRPGTPGGGTNAGITMEEQSGIGEDLVKALGEIPGYGRIAWWHGGVAAGANSALDGATIEWGSECKTYNWTNVRKRGIINVRDKARKAQAINDPRIFAAEVQDPKLNEVLNRLDFKGLLGVLVLLDFETGQADIFGHAMPKDPETGRLEPEEVKHITRKFVIAEGIPFTSSLSDPRKPDHVPAYMQTQPGADDWGF
jgi:hypothetical protein